MNWLRLCISVLTALPLSLTTAHAFNGHEVSEGPLKVTICEVPESTRLGDLQQAEVELANSGATALDLRLELADLLPEIAPAGPTVISTVVPAKGATNLVFKFRMIEGALSGLYPLHVKAWLEPNRMVHAIRIITCNFSPDDHPGKALDAAKLPGPGTLALAASKQYRVTWNRFGGPTQSQPPGWSGSDPDSGISFGRGPVARGESRQALQVHPPYKGGAGTAFVEYRVQLPSITPLQFTFYNAIRDHSQKEPPSDGATFRVWIGEQQVFERHTDAKTWLAGKADLSNWAGKEILLRLETHPGPKSDTTCDSAFWGDPVLVAGPPPVVVTAAHKQAILERARRAALSGEGGNDAHIFALEDGNRAVLVLGPNGLVDGALAFGTAQSAVVFDGFNIAVQNQLLGGPAAGARVKHVTRTGANRVQISHEVGESELLAEAWSEGPGLRLKISGSNTISDLSPGRADRRAQRVYYGHGYCLVEPGKFRAGGGGHNLSTSHIGLDFDNGLALLVACDTPPDFFEVDPAERIYALHTHPDSTFTFVPGNKGGPDCAIRYRPLYDKKAAPAIAQKAGRFVFDIWGGRYADDTRLLERCFDYGLTNALVLMHVWQRWGYDYRLPDIFPPLPSLGTLEELQQLGQTCRNAGALWGLHDNYIDIYPDATGFSYDHVTFDAEGRPRKAWFNEGRDAQSYQFRPDSVKPFLERNLALITPALRPSSSFVDVWTSINAFDYLDRQGRFHSKTETLRCWGEGFAMIREACGGGPATSEAGSDQLIGWLEGADCQLLQLGQGKRFHNNVPCQDWAMVPWFDAVNHARFSLHGVGYSDRYEGGRSRALHGIESDDYLTAEILTGHALMIDLPGMVRGAVRKYWLAQNFIESIAADDMASVEIDGEDRHRLKVNWKSGAKVWVNRGTNDWRIEGRVLPRYGYYARNAEVESSIERISGAVVEQSRSPGVVYVHGRGYDPTAPLEIQPVAERVDYLGNRNFQLQVKWLADAPAPKDLTVFYHFSRLNPGRYRNLEFYGGGKPTPGTSEWKGEMLTGSNWTVHIPEGMPLGEYDVLAGLYEPESGAKRYRLLGEEASGRRYLLGKLVVEGEVRDGSTNITSVRLAKSAHNPVVEKPGVNRQPTDFGAVRTSGGVRIRRGDGFLTLLPLPDGNDYEVTVRVDRVAGARNAPESLLAIDREGKSMRAVPFQQNAGAVTFQVNHSDFGYRMVLEH